MNTRTYTDAVVRSITPVIAAAVALLVGAASVGAQPDAARVGALLRDLKNPDFETANAALAALAKTTGPRTHVVAGLIDALRTGEWNRCAGDMRDGIARTLGEWKAKPAVPALLELVKRSKPIEHECSQ